MAMRVGLRVDAGATLGGGHVMRCLTLARALKAQGHSCKFISSPETLDAIPRAMWDDFPVEVHDGQVPDRSSGCFDLLVIDHYGLAAQDETPWRNVARKILIIDDLADRPHDCDVLLDQTYGVEAEAYLPLVPETCRLLLGSDYALLREEFSLHRQAALERRAGTRSVSRLLVSLGMTDVGGIAGRICALLQDIDGLAQIDVVLGENAGSFDAVTALAERDRRFRIHNNVRNMAELMLAADAAVGAGGTTTWERCALALPSLVVILADNQIKIAEQLASAGAIALAGDARRISDRNLSEHLRAFLAGGEALKRMADMSATICDGLGVQRVIDGIVGRDAKNEVLNGHA